MCCTIYSELKYCSRVSTLLVMFQRKANQVRKCKTDCISVKTVNYDYNRLEENISPAVIRL